MIGYCAVSKSLAYDTMNPAGRVYEKREDAVADAKFIRDKLRWPHEVFVAKIEIEEEPIS